MNDPLLGLAVYAAVILVVGIVVGSYASHQHRKYAALAEAEREARAKQG